MRQQSKTLSKEKVGKLKDMLRTRVKASVRCNGNTHQLEGILTAVSNKRIMIGNVSGTGFRPDEIVAVRKAREY